jgi:hypothetical protein
MDPEMQHRLHPKYKDTIYERKENRVMTGAHNYQNVNKMLYFEGSQKVSYIAPTLFQTGVNVVFKIHEEAESIVGASTKYILGKAGPFPNRMIDQYTRRPVTLGYASEPCHIDDPDTDCLTQVIADTNIAGSSIPNMVNATNYFAFPALWSFQCLKNS